MTLSHYFDPRAGANGEIMHLLKTLFVTDGFLAYTKIIGI
jgi:hypothetical protein